MKLRHLFEQNLVRAKKKATARDIYDRWLSTKAGEQAIDDVRERYPDYQGGQLDDAADWLMDEIRTFAEDNGFDFDAVESEIADLVINGLM